MNLARFNCDKCSKPMRKELGCTSDGTQVFFAGTENATRRCPRRHIIDNPDIHTAIQLWKITEGTVGADSLEKFSPHVFSALSVIEDGREAKRNSDEKERKAMDAALANRGNKR